MTAFINMDAGDPLFLHLHPLTNWNWPGIIVINACENGQHR